MSILRNIAEIKQVIERGQSVWRRNRTFTVFLSRKKVSAKENNPAKIAKTKR
jgi:hypothetical protein